MLAAAVNVAADCGLRVTWTGNGGPRSLMVQQHGRFGGPLRISKAGLCIGNYVVASSAHAPSTTYAEIEGGNSHRFTDPLAANNTG